jgi:hypothetical protein
VLHRKKIRERQRYGDRYVLEKRETCTEKREVHWDAIRSLTTIKLDGFYLYY